MARTKRNPQSLLHRQNEFVALKLTPYQQRRREFERRHKVWEERTNDALQKKQKFTEKEPQMQMSSGRRFKSGSEFSLLFRVLI